MSMEALLSSHKYEIYDSQVKGTDLLTPRQDLHVQCMDHVLKIHELFKIETSK